MAVEVEEALAFFKKDIRRFSSRALARHPPLLLALHAAVKKKEVTMKELRELGAKFVKLKEHEMPAYYRILNASSLLAEKQGPRNAIELLKKHATSASEALKDARGIEADHFLENVGMQYWGWLPSYIRTELHSSQQQGQVTNTELQKLGQSLAALETHRDRIVEEFLPRIVGVWQKEGREKAIYLMQKHLHSPGALMEFLEPGFQRGINVELEIGRGTHVGRQRAQNQDYGVISSRGKLAIIADGMGGQADGYRAAQTAAETVRNSFDVRDPDSLVQGFHSANSQVHELNKDKSGKERMGTTLTALHVDKKGTAHIVHVGDTRVYLLRDYNLAQLTLDHVVPNFQTALTQAIGDKREIQPFVSKVETHHGDVFLVCSDGVNKHVSDKQIRLALARCANGDATAQEATSEIIKLANREGASDDDVRKVLEKAAKARLSYHETTQEIINLARENGAHERDINEVLFRTVAGKITQEQARDAFIKMAKKSAGSDNITAVVVKVKHSTA